MFEVKYQDKTLRDEFAMIAMDRLLEAYYAGKVVPNPEVTMQKMAYEVADAMLAEREKVEKGL